MNHRNKQLIVSNPYNQNEKTILQPRGFNVSVLTQNYNSLCFDVSDIFYNEGETIVPRQSSRFSLLIKPHTKKLKRTLCFLERNKEQSLLVCWDNETGCEESYLPECCCAEFYALYLGFKTEQFMLKERVVLNFIVLPGQNNQQQMQSPVAKFFKSIGNAVFGQAA